MILPKLLCIRHLNGEHNELHKLKGCIDKKKSIKGYLEKDEIFPSLIYFRHEQLKEEFRNRGYKHKSPLRDKKAFHKYYDNLDAKFITITSRNILDLALRCKQCRKRIKKYFNIEDKK